MHCCFAIVHSSHQTAAANRCKHKEIEMSDKIKELLIGAVIGVVGFIVIGPGSVLMALALTGRL
jgi:hypothetical protein